MMIHKKKDYQVSPSKSEGSYDKKCSGNPATRGLMDMKDKNEDPDNTDIIESGEEELAILIKEAGKTARARKKKAMDEHFQKLHMAIVGTLPPEQSIKPI